MDTVAWTTGVDGWFVRAIAVGALARSPAHHHAPHQRKQGTDEDGDDPLLHW